MRYPDIQHHGATNGVTGSYHQLLMDDQHSLLADCDLFQNADIETKIGRARPLAFSFYRNERECIVHHATSSRPPFPLRLKVGPWMKGAAKVPSTGPSSRSSSTPSRSPAPTATANAFIVTQNLRRRYLQPVAIPPAQNRRTGELRRKYATLVDLDPAGS
ncbi:hypothetical protein E8F11_24195 [Pseudomonas sp. BN417]|nr:hypothetical protein [Pseudomonas sp. BN417]